MPQLTIQHPTPNQTVIPGQPFSVAGIATDKGMPEPITIDSVTVAIDNQPPVNASLKVIPRQKLSTVNFQAMVQVPNVPGPHTILVTATNDNGLSVRHSVTVLVASIAAKLQKVTMTFNTHNDNKDHDTVLHVFVKNRSNTTSTPEGATDFISNLLAFRRHEQTPWDINPYLAHAVSLAQGTTFDDPSSHTFDIPLRSTPIPLEEIVLPVVNIHILPNGSDRWIFSYTITFLFDDGRSFSASSDNNGVTGIILDQNHRNYSGIGVENPFITLPTLAKPAMAAVLTEATITFFTTDDDDNNKDHDTQLNVHIVNRLSASSSRDIAIGLDLFKGREFGRKSVNTVTLPLASSAIQLQDIGLPVVFINIVPNGHDRWNFDYQATFRFSNGQVFSSQTHGVILDQDNHKHAGVYQGRPFPTVIPPGRPEQNVRDHRVKAKSISLAYLQTRFDEFINNRQGVGSQEPPIRKLRLDNAGKFGSALPESYYDLQALVANPPGPGTLSPPGFNEGVTYESNPTSLGQLTGSAGIGDTYLYNLNSKSLTLRLDPSQATPVTVHVDFDTSAPGSGIGDWTVKSLSLRVNLSLAFDPATSMVDVLSWVPSITDDDQIGKFLAVNVVTGSSTDLGGAFQKRARKRIFDQLTSRNPFDGKTLRDKLNSTVTSWLVGGLVGGAASGCKVQSVAINGDNLQITYTGPESIFAPPVPAGWPSGVDFSRGNLAHIEHIVVLTMENHSFDAMLGYLSLPREKGGMGRKDVDGLKGAEFNLLNGKVCPSFAFAAQDTIFAPDPPHGYEPVHDAINGGKMDGFVQSYAEEHGPAVAPRIMGYHTAVNVPAYDTLARDFAICHRWFAAHPGPTFCNRFYELTGMLNVDPDGFWEFDNSSPLRPVFTPTIFDHLSERNISWKYFEHHYCFLRFFANHTFNTTNVVAFDDPVAGFEQLARTGQLPSVSFIDPHFIELPPSANCDGPPADVKAGQQLVQRVVEAVVTSPQWSNTLLIITYDEHGGFYDHVPPPAATKVSPESLGTYGVRVPTFVICPWVKGGTVFGHDGITDGGPGAGGGVNTTARAATVGPIRSLYFDHTSILKTIARTFMSTNPPYMGPRYADAHDLSSVIGNEQRPSQFLPFIGYNFLYGGSQKRLEVQGGRAMPGTVLCQDSANDTAAQQFSFEDAGGGSWYIRTQTGNLYLTADDSLGVKQDIKYPTDGSATAANNPDRQRWNLASGGVTVLDRNNFTISNMAFPGKMLQPAGASTNIGVAVVLGNAQAPTDVHRAPNAWQVTSPRLSGGLVTHQ
jgi:phospholipase C